MIFSYSSFFLSIWKYWLVYHFNFLSPFRHLYWQWNQLNLFWLMKLFIKLLVITIKCCIHSFLLVITNVLSRGFIIFVKSWCLCCLQIIICLFPHSLYYRLIQCTFLKNIFVLLFLLDFEDKWLWFIILFLMGIGIYLLWWD